MQMVERSTARYDVEFLARAFGHNNNKGAKIFSFASPPLDRDYRADGVYDPQEMERN